MHACICPGLSIHSTYTFTLPYTHICTYIKALGFNLALRALPGGKEIVKEMRALVGVFHWEMGTNIIPWQCLAVLSKKQKKEEKGACMLHILLCNDGRLQNEC